MSGNLLISCISIKPRRLFYAQEMVKFSRYIVAKFFEKLPKNPVLLAELVIWKNAKDCYELEEGYGSLEFRYWNNVYLLYLRLNRMKSQV